MKRHWLWFATAAVSACAAIDYWQKGNIFWAITFAALAVVWTVEGVKKLREPGDTSEST
jgi:hypothetical protein